MRRITLLTLALLLAGCSDLLGPDIPDHTVPMTPPSVYATWWAEVEAEAGLDRPAREVSWYLVRGGLFRSRDGTPTSGRWIPDGRIYLAEGWELFEPNVKHEMLHELLQGDPGHKHPLFRKYDVSACLDIEFKLIPCADADPVVVP